MYRFLRDNPGAQPPAPFTVSAIIRTHSAWRYLWPFQSRKQLISVIVIFFVMGWLFTMLLVLLGDPRALPMTLIGAFGGGMYMGVYRGLPAKMSITTRADARAIVEDLKRMIVKIGYKLAAQPTESGHLNYRSSLYGKLNGWAAWDEADIHVRCRGQQIDLLGPICALEQLERRLRKQLEA